MTERKGAQHPAVAWIERGILSLLLALVLSGTSSLAAINARIDVVIERQAHQTAVDEARVTHEARLVAIESSRFTSREADELKGKFDSQLLDMWRELQKVKERIPEGDRETLHHIEGMMEKLEARIRVVETK